MQFPQATGAGLPADKGKAYELEMLEQKEQEKRNALGNAFRLLEYGQ